ncbi:MetQ/NlpA family ABC transporter substrate-binding protein [Sporosarcina sp. GW1-11]|uniref:MetQ/NlpA family ABC transporter substrate-binding protein n=1 Tax=Sporosarcina sp. GW1-11 TaxID=2899126 RepID=UPI00294EBBBC|nr:MetQ/NlpA family ABC transporter substrate-binding protein [Sporosarcina sp. GW1-11]MDV6377973.1 MetQ/NlpA family ABC transporter substrate-binding protein [Sporosarcina sp. GW1-11]
MKMKVLGLLAILGLLLTACSPKDNDQMITIGTTEGHYAKVIDKALAPALKELGYTTEVKKYVDFITPNADLAEGDIDANMFQQRLYLDQSKQQEELPIVALTDIPSVGLGLYSNELTSIDDIPNGAWITIPNDELSTARALRFLEQQGLLSLRTDAKTYTVNETQIDSNPKKLQIQPVLTAQLVASLASGDLAVIPDNYVLVNDMELDAALAKEQLSEELNYIIAVREGDTDKDFARALKEAVQSDTFKNAIDKEFQGFGK